MRMHNGCARKMRWLTRLAFAEESRRIFYFSTSYDDDSTVELIFFFLFKSIFLFALDRGLPLDITRKDFPSNRLPPFPREEPIVLQR